MEIWKPLRNFPNYEASTEGRIRCIRTQRIQKPTYMPKGYIQVSLYKNGRSHSVKVRRLVADTFLGERPGMDIRHKDGDISNCSVDNLEYVTRSTLIRDAYERGTKVPGHVCRVRVVETGIEYPSATECARSIGCSRGSVYRCLDGRVKSVKGLHLIRL